MKLGSQILRYFLPQIHFYKENIVSYASLFAKSNTVQLCLVNQIWYTFDFKSLFLNFRKQKHQRAIRSLVT